MSVNGQVIAVTGGVGRGGVVVLLLPIVTPSYRQKGLATAVGFLVF